MEEFKLIVAGGREFTDYAMASRELNKLAEGELVNEAISIVSGMARGADAQGVRFAKENGVKLYEFYPDWNGLGKSAGFRRNEDMGRFADGLLAFWDGKSVGTKGMIEFMRKLGKDVRVINY